MFKPKMDDLLSVMVNFIFYFTIGFFGAFMKDLYETITNKEPKIKLGRILIGSIWTAFLFIFLGDSILKEYSINVIIFLTFLSGLIGFELFGKITTIAGLTKVINFIMKLKKSVKIDFTELTDNNDGDDTDKEKK